METILCLESVNSTNNRLRELFFAGAADGQVVIANEQTNGRGRMGREFVSPEDKGIYLSMLFCPLSAQTGKCRTTESTENENYFPGSSIEITAWTAVAVNRAIQSVCGVRAGIKWVNDLIMNRRKIGGILTEMSVESESGHVQYVIIGIGLNVNETEEDFPEELREIAASLAMETGKTFPRAQLAARIIEELDRMRSVRSEERQAFLNEYKADNITIGKEISIIQNFVEKTGMATSINDDFSLNVRYNDGSSETLSRGEVSLRGLYGGG